MAASIVCPICEFDRIACEHEQCPQCDADLTCFKVLDTLAAAAAQPTDVPLASKGDPERKYRRLAAWLSWLSGGLVLFGLVAVGYGFHRIRMIDARLARQQSALQQAVDALVARTDLLLAKQDIVVSRVTRQAERRRQPPTPAKQTEAGPVFDAEPARDAEPISLMAKPLAGQLPGGTEIQKSPETNRQEADRRFAFYRASDSDTLWGIAKRFYGSGHLYPVLLEHNPELSIYRVSSNDRIALLKDAREARRIYRAITVIEDKRLYWYYTVRSGDTPGAVKSRYCSGKDCLPTTFKADPNAPMNPGSRIKLALAGVSQ